MQHVRSVFPRKPPAPISLMMDDAPSNLREEHIVPSLVTDPTVRVEPSGYIGDLVSNAIPVTSLRVHCQTPPSAVWYTVLDVTPQFPSFAMLSVATHSADPESMIALSLLQRDPLTRWTPPLAPPDVRLRCAESSVTGKMFQGCDASINSFITASACINSSSTAFPLLTLRS